MKSKIWGAVGVMAIAVATATSSFGATANVLGTDDIYAAGGNSVASTAGGTTPASIALGTATSVTFSGASGTIMSSGKWHHAVLECQWSWRRLDI